jgi:16S rRNA (uracil1498-N3)-methyltransferase
MHLFFRQDISSDSIQLDREESRHCVKVLRLRKGDSIHLTDGKGNLAEGVIENDSLNGCEVNVTQRSSQKNKRQYKLTVAIAPTKNHDRLEWFVEKATEIGVDEIVPLICSHSERREVKTERLKNISISALKQSQNFFLPEISEAILFEDFIAKKSSSQKFICSCEVDSNHHLKNVCRPASDCVVLIGPEGDFTQEEIILALKNNFIEVSLGDTRLRTETAGIVACSVVNFING